MHVSRDGLQWPTAAVWQSLLRDTYRDNRETDGLPASVQLLSHSVGCVTSIYKHHHDRRLVSQAHNGANIADIVTDKSNNYFNNSNSWLQYFIFLPYG